MIALPRPAVETPEPTAPSPRGAPTQPASGRTKRLSVVLVVVISLVFLGGIAAVDRDSALALQQRAQALHDQWSLEAALVPIDRAIAESVTAVYGQVKRASKLGIRADPASKVLSRAAAYTQLSDPDRFARWDALETDLATLRADLEGRL